MYVVATPQGWPVAYEIASSAAALILPLLALALKLRKRIRRTLIAPLGTDGPISEASSPAGFLT